MKQRSIALLIAAAIAGAACADRDGVTAVHELRQALDSQGDTTGRPGDRGHLASLTVMPSVRGVAVGDSTTFVADLRDADGTELFGLPIRWTVADSSIARIEAEVDQVVVLRARRPGSTTVSAMSQGKTASALLVVADSVASVSVAPLADTVAVGDSSAFFAELRDAQGNPLADTLVERAVTWTVADLTVARIETAFGQYAVLRAQSRGSTTVTATSNGHSGSAELVVLDSLPPRPRDSVASMTVRPPADTLAVGDTASFFAEPRDAQGNFLGDRAITWTVADSTIAHIERDFVQSVVIRALRSGFTILSATSEGKSDSASIVVR